MWLIKGLLLLWVACGVGLFGWGLLEAARSYYILTSGEPYTIEGIAGNHSEMPEGPHTGSGSEYFLWFPRPVVEWVDRSGASHRSIDPNLVPVLRHKPGQKIYLKVYLNETSPADSQVFVSDYYTRFAFPAALMIFGALFIVLAISGWNILGSGSEGSDSASASLSTLFSFLLKYFIWPALGFFLFSGLMSPRFFRNGLVPDGWDRDKASRAAEEESAPRSAVTSAAPPQPMSSAPNTGVPVAASDAMDPDHIFNAISGETNLMHALKRGDPQTVRGMMERKFAVNAKDAYGRNVLYYAVSGKREDAVRRLINLGADIEGSSVDVLMEAMDVRNRAIAHILLDAGKSPNNLDKRYNMYPFDMAIRHELPDVAVRLAKQDAKHTAPEEFFEVARNPDKFSGEAPSKLGFGGVSLRRWIDMVKQ